MLKKKRLFTPGPTMVPEEVLLEMAEPVKHHRAPEFVEIFEAVNEKLKKLFFTKNPVLTFLSSGTGAMEGAVVNTVHSGDKVLVIEGGKFGQRWAEICKAWNIDHDVIHVEWGHPVDVNLVADYLKKTHYDVVFMTHSETSTGTVNDVKAVAELTKDTDTLLVVDGITSIGSHELYFDDWGIDVVVTGSQKGLMLPPGLAFAAISNKAWAKIEKKDLPVYYFDWVKAKKTLAKGQTPYTTGVSLIVGLNKALDIIMEIGMENIWKKHQKHGDATRAAVKAIGLELFSKSPSNVVTAINIPEEIGASNVINKMMDDFGIRITGGQEHLKGKIIRISHLGYIDDVDIISVVAALEAVMYNLGFGNKLGEATKAALEVLTVDN